MAAMKAGRKDNDLMQKVLSQATSVRGVNMEVLVGKPAEEPKKKRKYRNVKCDYDGRKFDSIRERDRYIHLRALEVGGIISNLECQVKFKIEWNGVKICTWTADFRYLLDGEQVVEDSKGWRTQQYKLRKKLMKAAYNIDIQEV